jgi:hypothetical protein
MFEVRLKKGHPTGVYRRKGIVFTSTEVKKLKTVPKEVLNDKWLEVTELEKKGPASPPETTPASPPEKTTPGNEQ